jgi:hypothetical protein
MARLIKFARGDAPAIDVQTNFSEENGTVVVSTKGTGGHKVKWQGQSSNVGLGSSGAAITGSNAVSSTYRVILPNGEQVAINDLVIVSRVVPKQSSHDINTQLSMSEDEMKAVKDADLDFRNVKAKRIERDTQVYGRVNTKSAAKPQRTGDEEQKEKDQERRRKREETVRSAVESGEVPENSASQDKSKKDKKKK